IELPRWVEFFGSRYKSPPRRGPGLLAGVFEFGQHFQSFLGAAWQYQLFIYEFQVVVRKRNQVIAHAEEAADRQHGKRLLSVCADEEIVDLADGFIGIVDNAGADDLGRAIASRELLYIDLGELHGLWRDLRSCGTHHKEHPDHRCTGAN